jgi:3-hydroxyacyl-[acyl-carrier-protein] dehydratase
MIEERPAPSLTGRASPTRMAPRLVTPAGDKSARAEVAIDPNDPVFTGHYPGFPVLPGAFVLEFTDQAIRLHLGDEPVRLIAIDRCRFLQPVYPGDHLELDLAMTPGDRELRTTASVSTAAGPVAEIRLRHATGVFA